MSQNRDIYRVKQLSEKLNDAVLPHTLLMFSLDAFEYMRRLIILKMTIDWNPSEGIVHV